MRDEPIHAPKRKLQVLDPAFEEAIEQYAQSVVVMEKEEFQPGIESFEVHAQKVKQRVQEAMHGFYDAYQHGYTVLLETLSVMHPGASLEEFQAKTDGIAVLDDPLAFMNFITEGHSIYELLGFSAEALTGFYKAAYQLVQQKRYEDARDAFYFLVTIAPLLGDAWIGLGLCYSECKQTESAIQACARAVELMPEKYDPYLTLARVFINMQDFEQAKKACDIGLEHAQEHSGEIWANELKVYMEEGKRQIDEIFQKSQSQSFSS